MKTKDEQFYIKAAWLWITGWTIFRLIIASMFPLVPDEAYYWQWSRYLALGYHDHAPMIAWSIKLGTVLFGNTELGVRIVPILSMAVVSGYMVAIANRWLNAYAAFSTAILSQGILFFNAGGLITTPDCVQVAAWAGAGYHVARAYEDGSWRQWFLSGAWFGFGMLSKFTMGAFLGCVFFYGLFSSIHRNRLASIRPYIGLILGFVLFTPVILWNADNGWASFRHVAYQSGANESSAINLMYFGDYWASQVGLVSPLVFILLLFAWFFSVRKKYTQQNWIYLYLFFLSFPLVFAFSILSLHTRVEGNWPAAGYISASILIAAFFGKRPENAFKNKLIVIGQKVWPWAMGLSYLITILVLTHVVLPVLPIPKSLDRTVSELCGWEELGQAANKMMTKMPSPEKTFLFGLNYQTASELAFYTPQHPYTVSINKWRRPNMYEYWLKDEDFLGWDAVGVTNNSVSHVSKLNQIFDHVDRPVALPVFRKGDGSDKSDTNVPTKTFYLYRAYGFKGGIKWEPENRSDVRAN